MKRMIFIVILSILLLAISDQKACQDDIDDAIYAMKANQLTPASAPSTLLLFSASCNTTATARMPTSIAREIAKTEDGEDLSPDYLGNATFSAVSGMRYPWQFRKVSTGIYQLRAPVTVMPGPIFLSWYNTNDIAVPVIVPTSGARLFKVAHAPVGGEVWTITFYDYTGNPINTTFHVSLHMVHWSQ